MGGRYGRKPFAEPPEQLEMTDRSKPPLGLFDSENLRSRLMDDDELVTQVLEACLPDLNANFRDYIEAVDSGEFDSARLCIHAMKGASQNAGLVEIAKLTIQIEESLRAGDTAFARESIDRLQGVVGDTIGAVRLYLNN